jgi:hypothetical protein
VNLAVLSAENVLDHLGRINFLHEIVGIVPHGSGVNDQLVTFVHISEECIESWPGVKAIIIIIFFQLIAT